MKKQQHLTLRELNKEYLALLKQVISSYDRTIAINKWLISKLKIELPKELQNQSEIQ